MKRIVYACIVACLLLLGSCAEKSSNYKIGVSQCAGGNWREKVNSELLSAQHLYISGAACEMQVRSMNSIWR